VLSKASATDYDTAWSTPLAVVGSSATGVRNITTSTASPSGGNDGDVWIKYTA
jgi:hypothetical protein